ncbi:MAG: ABC transporter substrate-binding protein [Desulfovibrio sp.]
MKRLILALYICLCAISTSHAGEVVHVFNWTDYIPSGTLAKFEQETGIKVVYATYESNEAMYTKVKLLGGNEYDVIVPSSYFVERMAREGLLRELEHSKIANLNNIDSSYLNRDFDRNNKHSVPYTLGGSGILTDTRTIDLASAKSWADLWNPAFKNRIQLTDDVRDVFSLALKVKGYSINETNPEHIKEAYELLKDLFPQVRTFNAESPKTPFINEEVEVGMIWNGEAFLASEEMNYLKFTWPSEGGLFWMDCFSIPKSAKNVENAYAFINFMLRPEIAREIVMAWGYATANKAALELLPEKYKKSSVIFPSSEVMAKSEFQGDVGDAILIYNKYWNLLKGGQ